MIALALLLAACAKSPAVDPPEPPTEQPIAAAPSGDAVIESIEETTVGDLDGVRVPMANMTRDTYVLPDGTEAHGLICALVLPDGPVFVGQGSEVEVEGTRWRVVGIEKPEGELGSVTLEKIGS